MSRHRRACMPRDQARREKRRWAALVVLGALPDPGADVAPVAHRQLLLVMRHAQLWRGAPVEQAHQVAAVRIAGDDHRPELGAGHDALVARQVEAARLIPLAVRRMARYAASQQDRLHVFLEADLRFCRGRGADGERDRESNGIAGLHGVNPREAWCPSRFREYRRRTVPGPSAAAGRTKVDTWSPPT